MPISGGGGRGSIFTSYVYSTLLAAGADFIPPVNTIIYSHILYGSAQKLDIKYGAAEIAKAGADLGATEEGYIGGVCFDGANWRYENTDVAQRELDLRGYTVG